MTLRVRPLVNVPPAGKVPLDGLKVHDNPVGRLGQLKANWSVKPFKEFMETLIAVELPTDTVSATLERPMLASSIFSATLVPCETPREVPVTLME